MFIEQVRAELQTKRREEKELRNNEKQHLGQISSLEGDIAKLTKSLERSRENYDAMKRSYTETCEEAERLRVLIAETRRVRLQSLTDSFVTRLTATIHTGESRRR